MAGILNNKERVMDFIITQEGKRQAGTGEMKMRFASFTDLHTFYGTSGSLEIPELAGDASKRIYFEAYNRYQDVIVPELEAGFSLRPFRVKDFSLTGGQLASGTVNTGIMEHPNIISGSDFSKVSYLLYDGIGENFKDQRIAGTRDPFSFYTDFVVAPKTGTYDIDNSTEYLRADNGGQSAGKISLDDIPSLFQDGRFSSFPNFQYLPPRNKPIPGTNLSAKLGTYPKFNEAPLLSLDEIETSLQNKQVTEFSFPETSRNNNIVIQIFEQNNDQITKLSVIDYGEFSDEDPLSPGKRVLYVGKILRDSTGAETFCCVFTVVID
tara:strand:+ start:1354 stop:2322 length:969 start_codon:yes stop_codon:yes gene_type:complete